jgi:hypothetical protein
LRRFTPAAWAAVVLFAWSVLAIADGTEAAPPPSVLVVLALAIALAAARNPRMRTTGRLLLILLAAVYVTAALGAGLTALDVAGLLVSAATGLLAIAELVRPRGRRS